jgi:hypothetical protein
MATTSMNRRSPSDSDTTPITAAPTAAALLDRARKLGFSMVGLARSSGVDGRRLSAGCRLRPAEVQQIEAILDAAEQLAEG